MPVTLHVLKSRRNGKGYVGITKDLTRRLREHRTGRSQAGRILRDCDLLHTEQFSDYAAARVREEQLKSGQGREWLDKLERGSWPACGG